MNARIEQASAAAAAIFLALGLVSCSSGPPLATQPPDLSGTWVLDPTQSDDPREELAGGRRQPGAARVSLPPAVSAAISASRVFKLEQQDSLITLSSAEGPRFVFFPDGRQVEQRISGMGTVRTVARWKGDRLEVERNLDEGVKIQTSYELTSDGRGLQVKTRISGGRTIKFDRVYRAADSGY